eukprot:768026-Hanusia_phi.AAC.2
METCATTQRQFTAPLQSVSPSKSRQNLGLRRRALLALALHDTSTRRTFSLELDLGLQGSEHA